VHTKRENSMVASGLCCKNPSVGVGKPLILSANGPTKQSSYLIGCPYSVQGRYIS